MDINSVFDTLFSYYNVSTFSDLAKKMEIGQSAISKWKKNNSIDALKKKCRELGIYNDIFVKTEIFACLYKKKKPGYHRRLKKGGKVYMKKLFALYAYNIGEKCE